MSYTISKEFGFSASHVLGGLPDGHPCGRLHGHNYVVRVELTAAALDPSGMVFDYRSLDPFKAWLDTVVDHRHLNELPFFTDGTNPTAETLARYLTTMLLEVVVLPVSVHPRVWVSETAKTWAVWSPP